MATSRKLKKKQMTDEDSQRFFSTLGNNERGLTDSERWNEDPLNNKINSDTKALDDVDEGTTENKEDNENISTDPSTLRAKKSVARCECYFKWK